MKMGDLIEVKEAPGKGRGVFATRRIEAGEIIEVAPVVTYDDHDFQMPCSRMIAELGNYPFEWDETRAALVFGKGSFMNHSDAPNCIYERNFAEQSITFRAARAVAAGEEICIDYERLWFTPNPDPPNRNDERA